MVIHFLVFNFFWFVFSYRESINRIFISNIFERFSLIYSLCLILKWIPRIKTKSSKFLIAHFARFILLINYLGYRFKKCQKLTEWINPIGFFSLILYGFYKWNLFRLQKDFLITPKTILFRSVFHRTGSIFNCIYFVKYCKCTLA